MGWGIRESAAFQSASNLPFIRHFTLKLGLACFLLAFNVLSDGFDLSMYNQIQAMTAFQQRFGNVCNKKTGVCTISTSHLSLLNSIPFILFAASLFIASSIGERFGRRAVYVAMNVVCLIGTGVTYSAKTYGQILAGRCIINIYTGFEAWLVPLFLAELVAAKIRGTVVSGFLFFRIIGSLITGCVGYKTANWPGDKSWQTPVVVMFVVPTIALLFCWVIPESPRWLLRVGKDEQALKALRSICVARPGMDIEMELVLLKESLELETEKGTWLDLFRGTNRRRTGVAMITNFFALATGQSFAAVYQTIFLKTLNTINPFLFNILSSAAGVVGAAVFLSLVDRVGRRRFWQTLAPMCAVCMLCLGALGVNPNPSIAQKNAIAAFFPIFGFFFMSSFAPLGSLTSAEIPSLKLRDKTAMAGWSAQNLTNFVASFTAPYLMDKGYANLQSKIGFIYGGIGIVGCIWAYFYYPELKSRSLEEIDEMMRHNIPAWKTKDWVVPEDSIGHRLTEMENRGEGEVQDEDVQKQSVAHVENSVA
ncbi:hypothetical protein Sste5346_003920 [Sporothrix stenoceras]|uniref:Major facilitator superfamily (MFS) profile domain-containing protein n=1 Tax=Sporothrix stenoceras TaxID=5173 RepID=A0ABR3ZBC0_9PEZI